MLHEYLCTYHEMVPDLDPFFQCAFPPSCLRESGILELSIEFVDGWVCPSHVRLLVVGSALAAGNVVMDSDFVLARLEP
jgi:hypothetical protein